MSGRINVRVSNQLWRPGVPQDGTNGQIMEKEGTANYETIWVTPVSTSAGAADANKLVRLDANGNIDATMIADGDISHANLADLSTGEDHSYIDQDITSGSSPTFDGDNITGVDADNVDITDPGSIITSTDVEGALQENRTAIDLNTTHRGQANPHSGSAASGTNSDITEITGLTTALSVAQGGTNSIVAVDARSNLGATASKKYSNIVFLGNSFISDYDAIARFNVLMGGNATIVDSGVSGDTYGDMLARFQTDALDHNPDLIVLSSPVNSIAQSDSYATILSDFNDMRALADADGVDMVTVDVAPWGGAAAWTSGKQTVTDQWNDGILDLGVPFAQVFDALEDPATPDNLLPAFDIGDGIHLSPSGYDVWTPIVSDTWGVHITAVPVKLDSDGNVTSPLSVSIDTTAALRGVNSYQVGAHVGGAGINCVKSRGTFDSPTAVLNGDFSGAFAFYGHDGTSYKNHALIAAKVNGAVSTGTVPLDILFFTGTTTPALYMTLKSSGILNIVNTPTYADNAAAKGGGLVDGDIYRTSTGIMMVVYT